jgi:hypothetical protein
VVIGEDLGVAVTQLLEEPFGTLAIGEEKGDRPGR